jgi:hypothetical protein
MFCSTEQTWRENTKHSGTIVSYSGFQDHAQLPWLPFPANLRRDDESSLLCSQLTVICCMGISSMISTVTSQA